MTKADWILTIITTFFASFIIGAASATMEKWNEPSKWQRPYEPTNFVVFAETPDTEKAEEHSDDNCPYDLCLKHGKKMSWMKDDEAWEER